MTKFYFIIISNAATISGNFSQKNTLHRLLLSLSCMMTDLCSCNSASHSALHTWGITTPNAAPIEIHVNCLNSMGWFHPFLTISTYSVAYYDKTWPVVFQEQVRYICLITRQILGYSPWRVEMSEQLKISSKSNSYPLLQTRHTSF